MERNSLHKEIGASYSVFGVDDKRVLQIDTYGTLERQIPGKKSQTLQLDYEGAEQLLNILKREFGFK
ncbi:methionyl-tRNA formyltransferase [Rhizobium cremeum]|nr:methionyl-tRNA formyltransferase [Rhizobium cremeum]MCJ7998513.1 methionyl-tRNA formyltransferase [Rhizobium cremeum]